MAKYNGSALSIPLLELGLVSGTSAAFALTILAFLSLLEERYNPVSEWHKGKEQF